MKRELVKVEAELRTKLTKWEREHKGQAFTVNDESFLEIMAQDAVAEEEAKRLAREEKARTKAELTEHELRYGHQPKTPARGRHNNTTMDSFRTPRASAKKMLTSATPKSAKTVSSRRRAPLKDNNTTADVSTLNYSSFERDLAERPHSSRISREGI